MKFETVEDKKERKQVLKLFGLHEHNFTGREQRFYRRCALAQATLTGFKKAVKQRYDAIHSKGLTVDHIVPLWGVDKLGNHVVSGLNVPWNLRGETKEENNKKGNLFVDNADAIGIILTKSSK